MTIHSVDVFGQPGTGTNSPTIPLGYVRLVQARNASNQVEFYLDYLTNPDSGTLASRSGTVNAHVYAYFTQISAGTGG